MTRSLNIFPDNGASICLAGPTHLLKRNLNTNQLTPYQKIITAVGGHKHKYYGWVPVQFTVGPHTTNQPLYICDKRDWIYFSRQGCLEIKIISPSFSYPMLKASSLNFLDITHQTIWTAISCNTWKRTKTGKLFTRQIQQNSIQPSITISCYKFSDRTYPH